MAARAPKVTKRYFTISKYAYQARPVLPLNVPEAMHDESVTVLVGGRALRTGMCRLRDFGHLAARPSELLQPRSLYSVQRDTAPAARRGICLLLEMRGGGE